jgi:hypothetical protein
MAYSFTDAHEPDGSMNRDRTAHISSVRRHCLYARFQQFYFRQSLS